MDFARSGDVRNGGTVRRVHRLFRRRSEPQAQGAGNRHHPSRPADLPRHARRHVAEDAQREQHHEFGAARGAGVEHSRTLRRARRNRRTLPAGQQRHHPDDPVEADIPRPLRRGRHCFLPGHLRLGARSFDAPEIPRHQSLRHRQVGARADRRHHQSGFRAGGELRRRPLPTHGQARRARLGARRPALAGIWLQARLIVMLQRAPTAYDDRIYGLDWRAWVDPEVPDEITPTALLLDRHLGTPVEHKAALIVDGEAITYGALAQLIAAVSAGLVARGVVPEDRILLFGTDSLDYVAMWLGAVRAGAVPAVVSDLYKARELLYFLCDTAARLCFIDVEQADKLVEIAAELPASLQTIIIRGEPEAGVAALAGRKMLPFGAIRDSGAPAIPPCRRHRN